MKIVLFAPGFRENYTSRNYVKVIKAIRDKGYNIKFIKINWFRTGIKSWTEEFNKEYQKYDPAQTVLAGFSLGSMTALNVASQKCPSQLWLFSLSCFFSEDIPKMPQSWLDELGVNRINEFRQLRFNELAPNIKYKTFIFIGDKEKKFIH